MTEGKNLVQMQAEAMAQRLYTDLMASAGVSHGRMSQEVLFFLPRDFTDQYAQLFFRAFAGKDDGGVGARGASQAEQGQLQMGKKAARKGVGKKFKRHWVIADDAAVELKDRIDKRLRAMARDIAEEMEHDRGESGRDRDGGRRRRGCAGCGRILAVGWKYCPSCGSGIEEG